MTTTEQKPRKNKPRANKAAPRAAMIINIPQPDQATPLTLAVSLMRTAALMCESLTLAEREDFYRLLAADSVKYAELAALTDQPHMNEARERLVRKLLVKGKAHE